MSDYSFSFYNFNVANEADFFDITATKMISIVSPAKSLDFDVLQTEIGFSQCAFLNDSQVLVNQLSALNANEVSELMNVSVNLAELNSRRFKEWNLPFNTHNSKQAAFAFKGDVYKGLKIESFSNEDLNYAQNHFRILSGLYGILKPLDLIQPYRLEMGTSLENSNGKNLYEFWGSKLTNRLNNDIKDSDSTYLLNLASNEYFKAVKPKDVKAKIITPVFKDWKNGEYKMISFFAKKARGLMASYQLKNKIKNPNDLKGFNEEGYVFNEDMSKNNNYVFTRIQQ